MRMVIQLGLLLNRVELSLQPVHFIVVRLIDSQNNENLCDPQGYECNRQYDPPSPLCLLE